MLSNKQNKQIAYDLALLYAKEKLRKHLANKHVSDSLDDGVYALYDYFMEAFKEYSNSIFDFEED